MKGTVTEAKLSKSGKSYIVQIAGQGYFAKLDSKLDQAVGQSIDYSVDPQNYQGKTINWIRDWDFDRAPSAPPVMGSAIPAQAPQPAKQSNGDRWWLNFVSNVVAHAVQAGHIKTTQELRVWAVGARSAIDAADGQDLPF